MGIRSIVFTIVASSIAMLRAVSGGQNDTATLMRFATTINDNSTKLLNEIERIDNNNNTDFLPLSASAARNTKKKNKTPKPTAPATMAPLKGTVIWDICPWILDARIDQSVIAAQNRMAPSHYARYPKLIVQGKEYDYAIVVFKKAGSDALWTTPVRVEHLDDDKSPDVQNKVIPRLLTSVGFGIKSKARAKTSGVEGIQEYATYKIENNGSLTLAEEAPRQNITATATNNKNRLRRT